MKVALRLNLVVPIDELAPFVPEADSATPAGKWQFSRNRDDQITRQAMRDHPRECFVQEMTEWWDVGSGVELVRISIVQLTLRRLEWGVPSL